MGAGKSCKRAKPKTPTKTPILPIPPLGTHKALVDQKEFWQKQLKEVIAQFQQMINYDSYYRGLLQEPDLTSVNVSALITEKVVGEHPNCLWDYLSLLEREYTSPSGEKLFPKPFLLDSRLNARRDPLLLAVKMRQPYIIIDLIKRHKNVMIEYCNRKVIKIQSGGKVEAFRDPGWWSLLHEFALIKQKFCEEERAVCRWIVYKTKEIQKSKEGSTFLDIARTHKSPNDAFLSNLQTGKSNNLYITKFLLRKTRLRKELILRVLKHLH
ncbi:unnamed protein product [Moneuplotes crassus]|uniref:Uncharacterized protein n=1 Tax=Euplotes crassus TaxID=5936 RepID=A0AAD1XP67_EUPCR|nr:unnamed protein product [Moneuplotes crassus]